MALALRELAADASLRASCGRAAAERVRLTFDWDAIAAATKEVYETTLVRESARSHDSGPMARA
jgi:glycosyltransferase involved in cell wall biosynthesis